MKAIRVVLADDHPVVRSGIRMLLEKARELPQILVVGEANNGLEVLHMVESLAPDVLLLDMELPGMSGLEVARQLQAAGALVRVVGLSAYDDEQYIFGLLESGASAYLTKEEALETIAEAVHGVMRGEEGWFSRRVMAKLLRRNGGGQKQPIDQVVSTPLTERERGVLQLLAKGWDNHRIGQELGISERTVKFHTSNIYQKFHVTTRMEAIFYAINRGWVVIPSSNI